LAAHVRYRLLLAMATGRGLAFLTRL
jgi:hypothetical protein